MDLGFILSLLLTGLIIGALARLAIPGRNPMGLLTTMLVGIAGAFIGGLVSRGLGLASTFAFVVAVLCAAAIVYFMTGAARGRRGGLFGGGRRGLI
ncbi:MAG TPA: hypothetical protein VF230_04340 [Acidimicrobiales bacterium]